VRWSAASQVRAVARPWCATRGSAVLALPLACVLVAAPAAAQAQGDTAGAPPTAAAPVFDGAYVLVPEASDTVRHAIDRAVRQFFFLVRPIARSRLERVNPVHARFTIEETAAGFRIDFGEGEPVVAPADGSPIPWTRPDGERLLLSVARDGGDLVQTFVAEDGRRENRFRFQPDGTLALYVTVESSRLAAPVTYTLIYRRASPGQI